MPSPLYARWDDNIFRDAEISATVAPMDTYDLDTLLRVRPDERVRFDDATFDLSFHLPAARRGDVLVIPVSNIDQNEGDESPTVLLLTNDAGLTVPIPVPEMTPDGIPDSIAVDLTLLQANATIRTSDDWTLHIANSVDVILGGAVLLYGPLRTLDDLQWGLGGTQEHAVEEMVNDHLLRVVAPRSTFAEALAFRLSTDDLPAMRRWYRANSGSAKPGLLWPRLPECDAYVGTWQNRFDWRQADGAYLYEVALGWSVLSKGKPVL